jgi:glycine hydroxymethyltransferase
MEFCKKYYKNLCSLFYKRSLLFEHLTDDVELMSILKAERKRQLESLELIASENFTSRAVLEANGTIFTNKYAEGYPHKRYYGGCENIDELELLCQTRALKAFNISSDEWGVNVQSYSGSTANFAVYTALLKPGDRLMGLDLPSGGHLTHGYQTKTRKISSSAIYFDSRSYSVNPDTLLIDYSKLEDDVLEFKPQLLIVGASAYVRDYDFKQFRKIADLVGAKLMADVAHTSGLIASGLLKSPFEYCDVVTTTTHKTLRGPRGALIFYKKELKELIDFSVFPSNQGGGHFNTISAIATALKQVDTKEFKKYSKQVINNAKYLASELSKYGFEIITDNTDNHIVLVNIKKAGLTGSKYEKLAELCNVSVNKNMIATDKSALSPSGIRLGTAAMTSRGFKNKDFRFVADTLAEIVFLGLNIQTSSNSVKLSDFENEFKNYQTQINNIKVKVNKYCKKFKVPK